LTQESAKFQFSKRLNQSQKTFLDNRLSEFDERVNAKLKEPFAEISLKSKALANSLNRCFEQARESKRFDYAFYIGLENSALQNQEKLLEETNQKFEEADFESFREFVRLLRACSLHIGGQTSAKIKELYNQTFKSERILLAYKAGGEYAAQDNSTHHHP
jgi:hypothetical protein